jgi:hypothetical protein
MKKINTPSRARGDSSSIYSPYDTEGRSSSFYEGKLIYAPSRCTTTSLFGSASTYIGTASMPSSSTYHGLTNVLGILHLLPLSLIMFFPPLTGSTIVVIQSVLTHCIHDNWNCLLYLPWSHCWRYIAPRYSLSLRIMFGNVSP